MLAYRINIQDIRNQIFIPKYYDPELNEQLKSLQSTHELYVVGDLIDEGVLCVQTGHEIGKMAYGTGNIPFVRTSDIVNWEIKAIPKQGVSQDIYEKYAKKEDIQPDDILLVRDGSYLIGTNCIITQMDIPMVFQSHILKFRVNDKQKIHPIILFLALNSSLVQSQIKNMQFTADIIDTLGNRFREVVLPIPKKKEILNEFIEKMSIVLETRMKYKAAIKQMPFLIEKVLENNTIQPIDEFFQDSIDHILSSLIQDTTTLEFGSFSAFFIKKKSIVNDIYLPKYYDPSITDSLNALRNHCNIYSIKELEEKGIVELSTGDEIGKMAYGTGRIPFVRTSDFSNWEIKTDTKQGVSEEIWKRYCKKEDVKSGDILIVRDGTYLIGTSCIISESDKKMLFCGGLIKLRVKKKEVLDEYLLLGLLNSYIVKRQIRTKQFTRDVIDTIGHRFKEVFIPIPNDNGLRNEISKKIKDIIDYRVTGRDEIVKLSESMIQVRYH